MEKKRKMIVVVTLAAIVIGFMIALRFETQKEVNERQVLRQASLAKAQEQITQVQAELTKLQAEQRDLSIRLDRARKQEIHDPLLLARLDQYHIMDGTLAVKGPGVRMNIEDSGPNVKQAFPLETEDLRALVNDLRHGGAEAISINGQRIVSTSAIVLNGEARIMINEVPISMAGFSAYEILAIGNQDTLMEYLKQRAFELRRDGMKVDLFREVVTVPSYKRGYKFLYASSISK